VRCTVSTDDPGILGTTLRREHGLAAKLGVDPASLVASALQAALCEDEVKGHLAPLAGTTAPMTLGAEDDP